MGIGNNQHLSYGLIQFMVRKAHLRIQNPPWPTGISVIFTHGVQCLSLALPGFSPSVFPFPDVTYPTIVITLCEPIWNYRRILKQRKKSSDNHTNTRWFSQNFAYLSVCIRPFPTTDSRGDGTIVVVVFQIWFYNPRPQTKSSYLAFQWLQIITLIYCAIMHFLLLDKQSADDFLLVQASVHNASSCI